MATATGTYTYTTTHIELDLSNVCQLAPNSIADRINDVVPGLKTSTGKHFNLFPHFVQLSKHHGPPWQDRHVPQLPVPTLLHPFQGTSAQRMGHLHTAIGSCKETH